VFATFLTLAMTVALALVTTPPASAADTVTISGRVVNQANGSPLNGLTATWIRLGWAGSESVTATTRADGSFSITVPRGIYGCVHVDNAAAGWKDMYAGCYEGTTDATTGTVQLTAGAVINGTFTPPAELIDPFSVSVNFISTDDESIHDSFSVTLQPGNPTPYTFAVTPGRYTVKISSYEGVVTQYYHAAAAESASMPVTLELGTPTSGIDFTLGVSGRTVSGRLVDEGGLPLGGVAVFVSDPTQDNFITAGRTRPNGTFTANPPTGDDFLVSYPVEPDSNTFEYWENSATVEDATILHAPPGEPAAFTGIEGSSSRPTLSWATAPDRPAAPTTTAAADSGFTVNWTAPDDGNAPINHYTISVYRPGESIPVRTTDVGVTSGASVTGLLPATDYTVTIAASNEVGMSLESAAAAISTITTTAPGAVRSLSATAASASTATVGWAAPASDGGSAVTGYDVTVTRAGSPVPSAVITVNGMTASISGLAESTGYVVAVAARNAVGTGASNSAPFTTPATPIVVTVPSVPGRPTGSAASSTTVTLSWAAPSRDGGAPVDGYRVATFSGSTAVASAIATVSGTGATISGLSANTAYTFKVAAHNSSGYGANSAPSAAITTTNQPAPTSSRIAGADRYQAAVNVSKASYPAGASVVYVVTGAGYADALSAGPAAAKEGGPLLLTPGAGLLPEVKAEIRRLAPGKIVVVGGVNSVSAGALAELKQLQNNTTRIGGADRYEASRNLAKYAFSSSGAKSVYIATGVNFPDALSAGAAAAAVDGPVVLVYGNASTIDAPTLALLDDLGVNAVTIAGGPASVTPGIETSLTAVGTVTRRGGADRFEASANINRNAFSRTGEAFLVTGLNFPDALSGSAWAGHIDAPVYLSQQDCVPGVALDAMAAQGVTHVTLVGGPNSLGQAVASLTRCS
jgi:putative cell wall-binding protein